jgi:hypothetical protein
MSQAHFRGRRSASETSTKKWLKLGQNIAFNFFNFAFLWCAKYLVKFNMRSRNLLVTLLVSDRSRCRAGLILISLAQPSRHFVIAVARCSCWYRLRNLSCHIWACRIASVVARCEFWYRLRNLLATLCALDGSSYGTLIMLATSQRSWLGDPWVLWKVLLWRSIQCEKILRRSQRNPL